MDFGWTEEQIRLREEVEAFCREELPPDWDKKIIDWPGAYGTMPLNEEDYQGFYRRFSRKVGEKGWHSLGWPREYGGADSWMKQAIVNDVMGYYRAPHGGVADWIAAPTILAIGSEQMKRKWLPRIARGEATFWLGYSEPNAGSDLASIRTTAVQQGDEYVINGQKIWSTAAHVSDYCWLIARTDPRAPKHKGISLFIVDNRSPGITIRPIINICGVHSFNEVFFDEVRVPGENMVGEKNKGFYHLMLALQYERLIAWTGTYRRTFEELLRYARETRRNGRPIGRDPLIQDKLAAIAIDIEILHGLYWKTAWLMEKGRTPEMEASALKLFATELSRKFAATAMEVLGSYGQLEHGSKWAPLNGIVCNGYLDSVSGPIGAGTSEVQYGIIATRGLGLPRM